MLSRRCSKNKFAFAKTMRRHPTEAERLFWELVRKNRLRLHFSRQRVILGFIVDFYCGGKRLIVEIDGSSHDSKAVDDAARDLIFRKHGFTIIRFPNNQVIRDPDSCVQKILEISSQIPSFGSIKKYPRKSGGSDGLD